MTLHRPWRWLWLLPLLLALLLRLSSLGAKPFWGDEVYSALRMSGFTLAEVRQQLADGRPRTAAELVGLQNPALQGRGPTATLHALAQEAPEHPPLFYLLLHGWSRLLGAGAAALRLLPALLGVALVPIAMALVWQLWASRPAALLVGLGLAVSPLQLLYAQECREYSLWLVGLGLTALALLRARRHPGPGAWLAYGAAATATLYTHLFALPVVLAMALATAWSSPRGGRLWRPLLLATAAAVGLFLPWLALVLHSASSQGTTNLWSDADLPPWRLLWIWAVNVSLGWVDFDPLGRLWPGEGIGAWSARLALVGLGLVLGAVGLAAVRRQTLLLGWLLGASLPLLAADLLLGGSRTAIVRYALPAVLVLQIGFWAQAGRWLERCQPGPARRTMALALTLLLALSLSSSLAALRAGSWWTKYGSVDQPAIAAIVNRAGPTALVRYEAQWPRILSLSRLLQPAIRLQWQPAGEDQPSAPAEQGPRFAYRPEPGSIPAGTVVFRSRGRFTFLPAVDRHRRIRLVRLNGDPATRRTQQ